MLCLVDLLNLVAICIAMKTDKVLRIGDVTRDNLDHLISHWMLCGFLRVLCILIGTRREQEKGQESMVASVLDVPRRFTAASSL